MMMKKKQNEMVSRKRAFVCSNRRLPDIFIVEYLVSVCRHMVGSLCLSV